MGGSKSGRISFVSMAMATETSLKTVGVVEGTVCGICHASCPEPSLASLDPSAKPRASRSGLATPD